MAVRPLDNRSWGFSSQCFVCEPSNPSGLRIAYVHDEDAQLVRAEFALGPEFSGAPRYVHGGVVLAVLDEAMAWAAIALAGRFAVVRHTATTFEHGVRVGRSHRVEARVGAASESTVHASAEVLDGSGRRCARAEAELTVLSEAAAQAAIGEVGRSDRGYLRARPESRG